MQPRNYVGFDNLLMEDLFPICLLLVCPFRTFWEGGEVSPPGLN